LNVSPCDSRVTGLKDCYSAWHPVDTYATKILYLLTNDAYRYLGTYKHRSLNIIAPPSSPMRSRPSAPWLTARSVFSLKFHFSLKMSILYVLHNNHLIPEIFRESSELPLALASFRRIPTGTYR